MHTAQGTYAILPWLSALVVAVFTIIGLWRYLQTRGDKDRPQFQKSDIIYQEWFASGNSERSLFTRMGGAGNCLRLVVTKDTLWITSWFPFTLFTPIYDLEHVIPLQSITNIERMRSWWTKIFRLTFVDERGEEHTLRLAPRHVDRFLESLGDRVQLLE